MIVPEQWYGPNVKVQVGSECVLPSGYRFSSFDDVLAMSVAFTREELALIHTAFDRPGLHRVVIAKTEG